MTPKRYADYPTPVRAEALRRLRERDGILCWAEKFDTESDAVIKECEIVLREIPREAA